MIWSCKARPCIHDHNYLVFPFHFQLCKIIIVIAKCAVKISFSYQKNKEDNSSLLCIKLSFLIRLICFCSLFVLRDWIWQALQQSNLHIKVCNNQLWATWSVPLNVYSPSAIIGLSLLNSILMARFLKQSFAQTCLKETDNGKLQQFNYSRSLITNRGTVERGKIHSARAMKQNTQTWRAASKRMCFLVCQELARQDNWPHCKELLCTTR